MHFIIWLPDDAEPSASKTDHLERVGLGELVAGAHFEQLPEGPSDTSGHLVSWPTPERRHFPYDEATQSWRPAAAWGDLAAGRYWIGWQTDSPPTPEDLLIRKPFDGPLALLGDGNRWMLPAPHWLPWDVIMADDGSYQFEPQVRFTRYIVACRSMRARLADPHQRHEITVIEIAQFVEQSLRINHPMPRELPSVLHLFSSGSSGTLQAALELLQEIDP